MGTSIYPIIEYDRCGEYMPNNSPFALGPEYIDLTNFYGLTEAKDYRFIAAVSGYRNDSDIEPLYALRGYPPNIHPMAHNILYQLFDDDCISWLTLSEMDAAIAHMGYTRDMLSWQVNLVLEMMKFLVKRMTNDYVRLVFAVN